MRIGSGRCILFMLAAFWTMSPMPESAHAGFGFGFGSDNGGKSGLDLNRGYDINTVTTVSGKVTSLPRFIEKEQVIIEIKNGSDIVNVSVGPDSFWGANGITVNLDDDLSAKGSLAQGQDGKTYLMAQKLTNRTTGSQVELRSERGISAWSGRSMNSMRSGGRSGGGMRSSGGGMMRGGGGMMRR